MSNHKSDSDWEFFAREDPYWAVLTQEKFHKQNLDENARADFFASGEEYVDWVFETIRQHVNPGFNPRSALDFGCGVGRLIIPLGARCTSVIGVDVSESMIREARLACESKGIRNARFVLGLDKLPTSERVSFINTFVVFQHIPCLRGLDLLKQLLALLADDGVGAIHITYSKGGDTLPVAYSADAFYHPEGLRFHLRGAMKAARKILNQQIKRLLPSSRVRGKSVDAKNRPVMQMNPYLLNPILHALQKVGVRRFHATFSEHSGTAGVVLFFQKEEKPQYASACLFET